MDPNREERFKRKRLSSFIIVLGYMFFGACEYVVILPTVWDYLQTLGVKEEQWVGFAVSIYSFASAIAGVIGGRLADKYYQHTKLIVVASVILRAVGNFQYLLGISKWNILCARMVGGIGTAAGTALMAEVCRTTTAEERTKFLSICNASNQMGILVGPALQLILSYFHFNLFGLNVNPLNAAGLFLGGLWLFFWLASVFLFHNLTQEFTEIEEIKNQTRLAGRMSGLDPIPESVEVPQRSAINDEGAPQSQENPNIYKLYVDEFLTDSYVLLTSLVFVSWFSLVGFETVIPIITQDTFGFGPQQNSFIYMTGGLVSFIIFAGYAFFGKSIRETTLLIVGLLLMIASQVWLIAVIPHVENGNKTHMIYFLLGIFILYLGTPLLSIGNTGLASKVLSNETQGLGQGIRRLTCSIGLVFGPTWYGSTVHQPYVFLGVTIAIMLLNGVMLMGSFKSLRKAEDKTLVPSQRSAIDSDDTSPLIEPTS